MLAEPVNVRWCGGLAVAIAIGLTGCATSSVVTEAQAVGPAESICASGSSLDDVAAFAGSGSLTRQQAEKLQRSTVRLSIQSPDKLDRILRKELGLQNFDLGIFAQFSADQSGICTGTLLDAGIVLTAGHCVSPSNYYRPATNMFQGSVMPPTVIDESGAFVRYFTPAEIARLFQADFIYQKVFVASAQGVAPEIAPAQGTVPIIELIDQRYDDPAYPDAKDFAFFRLAKSQVPTASFAMGWSRLRFEALGKDVHLAIIQHPKGGYKKISVGTLKSHTGLRLEYANISTEDGSSGAGILGPGGFLVGVHTRGGCDDPEAGFTNRGLAIRAIKREAVELAGR